MKAVRYTDPIEMLGWAADRIGVKRFRSDAKAIGLTNRDGALCAVAVFDNFSPTDCWIHIASEGNAWLTRAFVHAVFVFPFVQYGAHRITGIIAADNARAIRLAQHFGFQLEGALRESANDGGNELIVGMLRRECRFLPEQAASPNHREPAISPSITAAHDGAGPPDRETPPDVQRRH